jgi:hypothetical protein
MYDGYWDWMSGEEVDGLSGYTGEGWLEPNSAIGTYMRRAFVINNAASPTTHNIALERGYSISGTITLSTIDPPWHDFGDGTWEAEEEPAETAMEPCEGEGCDGEGGGSGEFFGGSSYGTPDGDPNDRQDLDSEDSNKSELVSLGSDINGQQVIAMPLDMMFMGGQDQRMGHVECDESTGECTFTIDGLAAGAYFIQPPFNCS